MISSITCYAPLSDYLFLSLFCTLNMKQNGNLFNIYKTYSVMLLDAN